MNTSSGLNKSGINQFQNIGSCFKTNQNFENPEKIYQKLFISKQKTIKMQNMKKQNKDQLHWMKNQWNQMK